MSRVFLDIRRSHEGMGYGKKLGFLPAQEDLLPADRLDKLRKSGRNSRLMACVL